MALQRSLRRLKTLRKQTLTFCIIEKFSSFLLASPVLLLLASIVLLLLASIVLILLTSPVFLASNNFLISSFDDLAASSVNISNDFISIFMVGTNTGIIFEEAEAKSLILIIAVLISNICSFISICCSKSFSPLSLLNNSFNPLNSTTRSLYISIIFSLLVLPGITVTIVFLLQLYYHCLKSRTFLLKNVVFSSTYHLILPLAIISDVDQPQ